MSIVVGYDATHANISHLPQGHQAAGYSTGSPDIKWTDADWHAHPGALRIDQDAGAVDATADYLDVERGAATIAEAPGWVRRAQKSYRDAVRPGQRSPAVYLSASQVTPLVNALIAAGIKSGVGLIPANWDLTKGEAVAEVVEAAGPFPIVGVQFASGPFYDSDVYSGTWLAAVSKQGYRDWDTQGRSSLAAAAQGTGMTPSAVLEATMNHFGKLDEVTSSYVDRAFAAFTPHIPAGATLRVRK